MTRENVEVGEFGARKPLKGAVAYTAAKTAKGAKRVKKVDGESKGRMKKEYSRAGDAPFKPNTQRDRWSLKFERSSLSTHLHQDSGSFSIFQKQVCNGFTFTRAGNRGVRGQLASTPRQETCVREFLNPCVERGSNWNDAAHRSAAIGDNHGCPGLYAFQIHPKVSLEFSNAD